MDNKSNIHRVGKVRRANNEITEKSAKFNLAVLPVAGDSESAVFNITGRR